MTEQSMDTLSLERCEQADEGDVLRHVRDQFVLPDGLIYLDGNSLGPLPKAAVSEMTQAVQQEWGQQLIGSWNSANWFQLPEILGAKVARLIGAKPDEVVVCDSTSVNLYKLLSAALQLRPGRSVLVGELDSFPTDLYMMQGVGGGKMQQRLHGRDSQEWGELIDDQVAAVVLSHVDYRSGQIVDLERIVGLAHEAGALVILDLCHSAGVLPVDLHASKIDMAVGCSYKYLNGGPGAPAFLFVREALIEAATQPLQGWWGHNAPFAFEPDYQSASGIKKFLCSTQPILSLRGMCAGLEIYQSLDLHTVRRKSQALTQLFLQATEHFCSEYGVTLASPRNAELRGSQVSFRHEQAYPVMQALIERGVVGDFRAPNILRFGFSPLYLGYVDVWQAVQTLRDVLASEVWREEKYQTKAAVT